MQPQFSGTQNAATHRVQNESWLDAVDLLAPCVDADNVTTVIRAVDVYQDVVLTALAARNVDGVLDLYDLQNHIAKYSNKNRH